MCIASMVIRIRVQIKMYPMTAHLAAKAVAVAVGAFVGAAAYQLHLQSMIHVWSLVWTE